MNEHMWHVCVCHVMSSWRRQSLSLNLLTLTHGSYKQTTPTWRCSAAVLIAQRLATDNPSTKAA